MDELTKQMTIIVESLEKDMGEALAEPESVKILSVAGGAIIAYRILNLFFEETHELIERVEKLIAVYLYYTGELEYDYDNHSI